MFKRKAIIANRHRGDSFISLWETTGVSETIQLPITNTYTIDWGDGVTTTNATSHVYASIGSYTITIFGNVTDFIFSSTGDRLKIKNISKWGKLNINEKGFFGCENLTITATDKPTIVSLRTAFANCFTLALNNSVSDWDVSNATSLQSCFYRTLFNQDINSWDVSNVNDMQLCFEDTPFNQDISSWDVSSVTNMSRMFYNTPFNQNISTWITTSLTNMSFMFYNNTSFNQDLGGWDVSNVTTTELMFYKTLFNYSISSWDTSNVQVMAGMFNSVTAFNQDISSLDFSSIKNMQNIMVNKSSANYTAVFLSNLYIRLDDPIYGLDFASMTNVNLGFGTIKYTALGSAARANLISKGFIITDGGLV